MIVDIHTFQLKPWQYCILYLHLRLVYATERVTDAGYATSFGVINELVGKVFRFTESFSLWEFEPSWHISVNLAIPLKT